MINIPNILTCCNLICGCIATYAAFHHGHGVAFAFILLGAFFDFFDGMVARILGISGKFGLQLDSLADDITFGLAPSAMIFTLFNHVAYPQFMANEFFYNVMPFTAFLMAAFSALRLAKFNLDERQHLGFIGMPTPANAIFWGGLISSCEMWLRSPHFNAAFLFLFMILSCWLLICEVPMFALKFKNLSWQDNKIKFIFAISVVLILLVFAYIGYVEGNVWQKISLGMSVCIGLYVMMSIVASLLPSDEA